jgi:hypothetical protein
MKRFRIDEENNGDTFWHTVRLMRRLCDELSRLQVLDAVALSDEMVDLMKGLKGWDDGPEYAPHPLIEI